MFKSIEYKLYLYLLLLIVSVGFAVFFFFTGKYVYGSLCVLLILYSLNRLYFHYNKYNKNILFLFNALDNGDYGFHFSETKLSRRERELNKMMNRIKEILSKAKQEVVEKEKFLGLIIENVPTGILILDENQNIRNANKVACRLMGLPVLTHLNQLKVIDPEFPQLFQNLQVGDDKQIKVFGEKDIAQISLSISQIKIQNENLRIITLNNIESELEKREMESWIKLIRVMTHEIMNSITPITSLTEMLLFLYSSSNSTNEEIKETTIDSLATINTTAKELSTFVDSYRHFSGISTPVFEEIILLPFIKSILHLEKVDIDANAIQINVSSNDDHVVLGDRSQLTRVIVNLLKNAIEALDGKDEKRINIDISNTTEDKVQVNIANNGEPIPADILENIFIPFFTTKNSGTGIGLSVSRYIIRLHEGNLKHIFENGWTIFSLTLKTAKNKTSV